MLHEGQIFEGRFQILSIIGKGGAGTVYKAKQRHMDKIVAIKTLSSSVSWNDDDTFLRFEKESRAASALAHTNIISILDFGKGADGRAYLVMEYLGSKNLDDVLKSEGHIDVRRFYRIFSQICDGLEHAHKKGIIHRDIKPSNIMLMDEDDIKDIVKIVDFGLAKLTRRDEEIELTKTGAIMGTPLYMSPEQCRGLPLDHRSDIYSLGCVMYKSLTGTSPVIGTTPLDTLYRHTTEEPAPFTVTAPDLSLPAALEQAILKALKKDPNDRQQSMAELRNDIRDAILMPATNGTREADSSSASAATADIDTRTVQSLRQSQDQMQSPKPSITDGREIPTPGQSLSFSARSLKAPVIAVVTACLIALAGGTYLLFGHRLEPKVGGLAAAQPTPAGVEQRSQVFAADSADDSEEIKRTPESQLALQERIKDGETTIANPNGGAERVLATAALAPHSVRPHGTPIDRGGADAKAVALFIRSKKEKLLHQAADSYKIGDWSQAKSLYEQSISDDLGGVSDLDKFATSAHIIDCDIKLSLSMNEIKGRLDKALTLFNKQRNAMMLEISQRKDAQYIWRTYGRITVDAAKRTSGEASAAYWRWAGVFYNLTYTSWKEESKKDVAYKKFLEQYLVVDEHNDRRMVRQIQAALKKLGADTGATAENSQGKQRMPRTPSRRPTGHHGRLVGPGIRVY